MANSSPGPLASNLQSTWLKHQNAPQTYKNSQPGDCGTPKLGVLLIILTVAWEGHLNPKSEPKPISKRRGINIKLVLFVSIVLSLVVRQVFGSATVRTVVFPLDAEDQHRIQLTVQADGVATFELFRRTTSPIVPGRIGMEASSFAAVDPDGNYVERLLTSGISLRDETDGNSNRTLKLLFNGKKFAEFQVSSKPKILNVVGTVQKPLVYSSGLLLPFSDSAPFSHHVSINGRDGIAVFGRSLERVLDFESLLALAVRTNSSVTSPWDPSRRQSIRSIDLGIIKQLREQSAQHPSDRLAPAAIQSNLLSDPLILNEVLPELYQRLSRMHIRYIELATPNALSTEWLTTFQRIASELENKTGISVRLIAEVNSLDNPKAESQLQELSKSIEYLPYLSGFAVHNEPSNSALIGQVENLKKKKRFLLNIYRGNVFGPVAIEGESETSAVLRHLQTGSIGFTEASKKVPRSRQTPGIEAILNLPSWGAIAESCASLVGNSLVPNWEI